MSIGNPEIVTGAKGPRDLNMLPSAQAVEAFVAPKEGEVVFRSRIVNFMIQIKGAVHRMVGDVVLDEPPIIAKFSQGEYRTTNPEHIAWLKSRGNFGLTGDYWDQSEAVVMAEEAQYAQFLDQVERNPKLKARLAMDANLKDFKLPPKPIAAKGDAGL
jgi:hypothetical protein